MKPFFHFPMMSWVIGIALALVVARAFGGLPLGVGIDANYSLGMETNGAVWRWGGGKKNLFQQAANEGVRRFRVRLWTKDDGQNGKNYATEIVKRTTAAGLEPYLVLFLSDDWADMVKQPAPANWKDLALTNRAEVVREYSREIVKHFRSQGLRSHVYEIGNEIDYGICGVYPSKGAKKNPRSLSAKCWPEAAQLIRASEAGVREADPEAKFILHIAHWWDAEFCKAFFRFMLDHGVRVDFAGLSYFPSANIGGSLEMEQFGAVVTELHEAIQRPIIIPETAYPSTSDFHGQFSRWKKETPGYPLTLDGQRRWLADFLDFCAQHPAIADVYYWSPEWYGEGMWKAFALFDPNGKAKPAWASFTNRPASRLALKTPLYFEVVSNSIVAVPVGEAKQKAAVALREELQIYGGVTTNYIRAITTRILVVGAYRVSLRASLTGNVDLNLVEAPTKTDWKADLEKADAAKQKIILFIRSGAEKTAAEFQAYAERKDFVVLPHPLAADKPLKFGFGQGWQDDAD